MTNRAINLAEKLVLFQEAWSPKIIGGFNGHDVMLVKIQGEFTWHSHADTDDFFLVLEGEVEMHTNHALEDYEVRAGYVLSCQSFPVTDKVVVTFDE